MTRNSLFPDATDIAVGIRPSLMSAIDLGVEMPHRSTASGPDIQDKATVVAYGRGGTSRRNDAREVPAKRWAF